MLYNFQNVSGPDKCLEFSCYCFRNIHILKVVWHYFYAFVLNIHIVTVEIK